MENPFKRLRKLTTLEQKDFAAKYGFAKTTMTYIESGQYPDLSEDMLNALGSEFKERGLTKEATQVLKDEYNVETLQDAYHTWQATERVQIAHLFQVPFSGQSDEKHSPFYYFVREIAGTRQKFCKQLKVPAASVMRYETGATKTMPKAIEDALTEVRYPYLRELKEAQSAWVSS